MIKKMVVSLCSIGVDATLGDGCGIWEHLHSFREVKCSQYYSKILWMGIKIWRVFPLADEHSVVVMTKGSQSRRSQILADFRFPFYQICVQNQWEHKILRFWLRTPILAVLVHLALERNIVCFSILILLTLCGKSMKRGGRGCRKHCFVNFCSLALL